MVTKYEFCFEDSNPKNTIQGQPQNIPHRRETCVGTKSVAVGTCKDNAGYCSQAAFHKEELESELRLPAATTAEQELVETQL